MTRTPRLATRPVHAAACFFTALLVPPATNGQPAAPDRAPTVSAQSETLASLSSRGIDLAVLYGLASPEDKAAIKAAAAAELASLPPHDPDDPDFDSPDAAFTFRRARANVLAAAASDDAAARRAGARAAAELLDGWEVERPLAESARRVTRGAALLLQGGQPEIERARPEFDAAAPAIRADPSARAILAEAIIGGASAKAAAGDPAGAVQALRTAMGGEPFLVLGKADAFFTFAAAEAIARILRDQQLREGGAASMDDAVAELNQLNSRLAGVIDAPALRSLVYSRIDRLVFGVDSASLAALPPEATLARAITLARAPATRAQGLALLDAVAARPDAGNIRADALWEIASLLSAASGPDALRASAAFTILARDFPDDPRAGDAAAAGVEAARLAAEAARPGPAAQAARAAYAAALDTAIEGFPARAERDAWVCRRAALLLEDCRRGGESAEADRARAITLLERIGPASPRLAEATALFEQATAPVFDAALKGMNEARDRADAAQARSIARALAPAARRAADWAAARGAAYADRFLADWADAVTESGSGDAAAAYRDILDGGARIPGGVTRARLGRARALLNSGDAAGAFTALRELAARLDAAHAGDAPRPPEFWHAWALMVEILADQNKDGARSASIRAQLARLRMIDPAFGGPPWKDRIEAVRAKLDR